MLYSKKTNPKNYKGKVAIVRAIGHFGKSFLFLGTVKQVVEEKSEYFRVIMGEVKQVNNDHPFWDTIAFESRKEEDIKKWIIKQQIVWRVNPKDMFESATEAIFEMW